jgi:hypothetical protein
VTRPKTKYAGEKTSLAIGDRNVIREYCTINRGTAGEAHAAGQPSEEFGIPAGAGSSLPRSAPGACTGLARSAVMAPV